MGAKNAILPIIAAALLCDQKTTLRDVPELEDVNTMCHLLSGLGGQVMQDSDALVIGPGRGLDWEVPFDLARMMRASFLMIGPLLARLGRARASLPGGCAIGSRPIDLHLKGFQALGASVHFEHGYIEVSAKRLRGTRIYLDFPSVTATENIMMAAVLAEGTTSIENAAEEPEVVDLARYLQSAGARVFGAGTNVIRIEGVPHLDGVEHQVIPDRIDAATFMVAAAITGGTILVDNVVIEHVKPVIAKLREAGVLIEEGDGSLTVSAIAPLKSVDIKTLPYPGFPTDMQAQFMALMTVADGTSIITETIFENRFMHVDELKRMGSDIRTDGRTAIVKGVPRLTGARVRATDLRAGASLVLAGLAADGVTEVSGVTHIDRGYHCLDSRLADLGARIRRVDTVAD